MGGFLLGNKNKDEWRSALHKLEKTPDQKVQSVLRVSYDRLENEIKSTFLDIACFFKGEDKDFVSRILGRRAKHEINVLCQRCLITISDRDVSLLFQKTSYTCMIYCNKRGMKLFVKNIRKILKEVVDFGIQMMLLIS